MTIEQYIELETQVEELRRELANTADANERRQIEAELEAARAQLTNHTEQPLPA